MVVFTCQHCNASLKKPVVEKHYNTVCRRKPYLTCVDCLVDFRGDEYISHTSCVSEEQRYGDKNFVPKPVAVKQNNWLDVVQLCIKKNENPKFKPIFQSLSKYPNVPRKKPKFINFLKNGLKIRDENLASEIFDVFQYEFMKNRENKSVNEKESNESNNLDESLNNSIENEDKGSKKSKKKDKKRNHISESSDVSTKEEGNVNGVSEQAAQNKNKKSKKQKAAETQNDSLEELNNASSGDLDASASPKDEEKKKKKKKKSLGEIENPKESQVEQETDVSNLDGQDTNVLQDQQEKLSKKELKKLKKKQKYEAELKEIEENKNVESDNENKDPEAQEDTAEKGKSKKHKKRKATLSESETDNVKKQKVQEEVEENATEDNAETVPAEPSTKAKFNWEEVIKEVLLKSSEHELAIKRLSKKVLAEYQAVKGDRETFEQLISKFNKKINKIPGVRILKDKAKLIIDE